MSTAVFQQQRVTESSLGFNQSTVVVVFFCFGGVEREESNLRLMKSKKEHGVSSCFSTS